jgi:alkylresorcinol/alkylpyrone synthase
MSAASDSSSAPVQLLSLATAVPDAVVDQAEARELARALFGAHFRDIDRLLQVFAHAGIERRHVVRPVAWFHEPHTFAARNAVYTEVALELGERVATAALQQAAMAPSDVGALLFVSSTGIATPSLDAELIPRLGLRRDTLRVPVFGLGCAGGGGGLSRAAVLARGLGRPVLLVNVELCSATFVHGDRSKSNLVATSLFGDGAAAVVVAPAPPGRGAAVLGHHARLLDGTQDVMGWDVTDAGLQVRFARSIPDLVHTHMADVVDSACRAAGLAGREAIVHWVVHPGGPKVLQAYADALALAPAHFAESAAVLRDYGNMSGPSVLFVLERLLRQVPASGAPTFVVGMGPGFSAEGVVLRW